jgi:hypothetical protein
MIEKDLLDLGSVRLCERTNVSPSRFDTLLFDTSQ